jgi:hypothetical protein
MSESFKFIEDCSIGQEHQRRIKQWIDRRTFQIGRRWGLKVVLKKLSKKRCAISMGSVRLVLFGLNTELILDFLDWIVLATYL